MKKLLPFLFLSAVAHGQSGYIVQTDTNGLLFSPTNLWDANIVGISNALVNSGFSTGGGVISTGGVVSVGLSAPAEFTVTGSPITNSGTLTFSKANQNANLVFAGPTTGAAAAPTFRLLVTNDLPAAVALDGEVAALYLLLAGGTLTGDLSVPNEAYGVGWNGSVEVPTKDAVYDKIESLVLGGGGNVDSVFGRTGVVTAVAYDYSANQISVGFSPTNYTATDTNVLSHLVGLDYQLGATFVNFISVLGGTMTGDLIVPDEAYDATSWNGNNEVPTKNAIRDKIESMGVGSGDVVGPASSLAYEVAIYDDLTGKLLGNSGIFASNGVLTVGTLNVDALAVTEYDFGGITNFVGSGLTNNNGTLESISGGSGTVTSVALSAPAEFSVSGSPVTTSGTLTFAKANQNANLVYAGPSSGAAAAPTFRALATNDMPAGVTLDDEAAAAYQPLDSDLTTLASLNGAALTNLNGSSIASGTVADARIDAAIARDSEVAAAYQPLDSDLTTLATLNGGSLTNLNGSSIASGTVADARIDAAIARDAEVAAAYEPLNANKYQATNTFLTTLAGVGAATGTNNVMRTRTGVYRDLFISAGAFVPSTTNGAATGTFGPLASDAGDTTKDVFDFDDTTSESVQFSLTLPDTWDLGTLKIKLGYSQVSATTGTNVLSVAAKAVSSGDSFVGAFGTAVTTTNVVADSTNKLTIVTTGALTVGGTPAAGDEIVFKVSRLPSNDYDVASGDLRLHWLRLQYAESTTEPSAW